MKMKPEDVPWLTTEQMVEVDRAMMEDLRIELLQMMASENAGRNLAHLARQRFLESNHKSSYTIPMNKLPAAKRASREDGRRPGRHRRQRRRGPRGGPAAPRLGCPCAGLHDETRRGLCPRARPPARHPPSDEDPGEPRSGVGRGRGAGRDPRRSHRLQPERLAARRGGGSHSLGQRAGSPHPLPRCSIGSRHDDRTGL